MADQSDRASADDRKFSGGAWMRSAHCKPFKDWGERDHLFRMQREKPAFAGFLDASLFLL